MAGRTDCLGDSDWGVLPTVRWPGALPDLGNLGCHITPSLAKELNRSRGSALRRGIGQTILIHVLPSGFHRIRHYGLFASNRRKQNIARARQLLNVASAEPFFRPGPVSLL
jgi:hypothetical protein